MPRAVKEWIGKTDDSRAPPRVALRVFQREDGVCHLTGVKIQPGDEWDLDHKIALINGGENRESNLFPALRWAHAEKTRADVAEKSAVAKLAQSHAGIKRRTKQPLRNGASLRGPERAHEGRAPAMGLSEIARRFGGKA